MSNEAESTVQGALNVLGSALQSCSFDPLTGYFRDGCCNTDSSDHGSHTVCVKLTRAFLEYSKSVGNDLSTPQPQYRFAGLKPGDRWCLCAARWLEAYEAGAAPLVVLEATHQQALAVITLGALKRHAYQGA
jgi:uncharacterized protein